MPGRVDVDLVGNDRVSKGGVEGYGGSEKH